MTLNNVRVNEQDSALETLCVAVKGIQIHQLERQLTALMLNCVQSADDPDGGDPCAGTQFEDVFDYCNATCIANTSDVGICIGAADCLNNGGEPSLVDGKIVCAPDTTSCHDNPLLWPDSPAGSQQACNSATGNSCYPDTAGSCTNP
jgi:hypothetical protein